MGKEIGLALVGGLGIGYLLGNVKKASAMTEPGDYRQARAKVTVRGFSMYSSKMETLEWYIQDAGYSPDFDQFTITYRLVIPGRGYYGDIEGYCQVYNHHTTRFSKKDYPDLVFEFTRLSWAEQEIITPGGIFNIPQTLRDNEVMLGYVTFRIPV